MHNSWMNFARMPLVVLLALLIPATSLAAMAEYVSRVEQAGEVLKQVARIPEQAIPAWLLSDAQAVAVIPGVVKAGFVVGGRRGHGVLSVRDGNNDWSLPSFITLTGGSVGFQAGVQSSDVVLVFKSRRSIEDLVRGKFTLGGDASVAAGPVGRSAEAATDTRLTAEIYAYSRSRGLFAGVALDGSALRIDHDGNEAVYGAGTTPRRIFAGHAEPGSDAVDHFRNLLRSHAAGAN